MAAGFIIAEIEVTDPAGYEEYRRAAARTLEAFGGTYLVRGGAAELLEGQGEPKRLVVLRFDSADRARAWWESREYAAAREIRRRTAAARMILVEGA
jgi:uncharacterized protein (DUF1330 family)